MNRAELIRRYLAYKVAVEQLHKAIKADGRHEFEENETAPTYRLPFATASASVTNERAQVTDHETFMAWLAGRHPTEVITRTVREVRNPDWLAQLLGQMATFERGEDGKSLVDEEGTVIPGVQYDPGGEFITMGVVPRPGAKRALARAAAAAAATGDWSGFEALVAGKVPLLPTPGMLPGEEMATTYEGRPVDDVEAL